MGKGENISDTFTRVAEKFFGVEVVKEYKFHTTRRWRFDYAIVDHKIAIEVEGGVWTSGRHTRSKGFLKDMEKYNTATSMGWRLLRTTPDELMSCEFFDMISKTINC